MSKQVKDSYKPAAFTRAALYMRVSSGRQAERELSIPDQRHQLREHCARQGLAVAEEFVDAKSARDGNRPDLQRILAIVESGQADFDVLLVHSFSRFFRKLVEAAVFTDRLRAHGVEIVSISQPLPTGPAGDMMRYFLMIFDEYQSAVTAKHVERSLRENARQGFWSGGISPYGFKTTAAGVRGDAKKKKLIVDPDEAETVRLIFDLYLTGDGTSGPLGTMKVAKWLNNHGFRNRKGGPWSTGKIYNILTNRAMIGTYMYGRSRKDTTPVEVQVPAIISDDIFAAVQKTLRERNPKQTPPRVTTGPILLTGIVTCGHCGAGMTITTGKGGQYKYYTCASLTRTGAGSCDNKRVPMADLDELVTDNIVRKMLTPERTTQVLTGLLKRQSARDIEKTANLASLRERLGTAQARLDRYYDFIDEGTLDPTEPTLKDRIETATTERNIAKVALDRMTSELSPSARVTEENVAALADLLRKNITTGTIEFRRSYLRAVIKEIQVSEEKVRIVAKRSELERMVLTLDQTDPRVPSFVPGWRRDRDNPPFS